MMFFGGLILLQMQLVEKYCFVLGHKLLYLFLFKIFVLVKKNK